MHYEPGKCKTRRRVFRWGKAHCRNWEDARRPEEGGLDTRREKGWNPKWIKAMTGFDLNGRSRPRPPQACRNFCGDLALTMKQEVRERYESICSHEIFRLESQTRGSLDSSDKVQIPIWTLGLVISTNLNTIYYSSSPIDLAFTWEHWP